MIITFPLCRWTHAWSGFQLKTDGKPHQRNVWNERKNIELRLEAGLASLWGQGLSFCENLGLYNRGPWRSSLRSVCSLARPCVHLAVLTSSAMASSWILWPQQPCGKGPHSSSWMHGTGTVGMFWTRHFAGWNSGQLGDVGKLKLVVFQALRTWGWRPMPLLLVPRSSDDVLTLWNICVHACLNQNFYIAMFEKETFFNTDWQSWFNVESGKMSATRKVVERIHTKGIPRTADIQGQSQHN